jgi:hypothetical protein
MITTAFSFKGSTPSANLPLLIAYKNTLPPDSIQDFLKVYLQTKKIEVINWKQAMSLYAEENQSQMLYLINSGRLNEQSAKDFTKNMQPVYNILAITIYRDTLRNDDYLIDSVHWQTDVMPIKDTVGKKFNSYIPEVKIKRSPYAVLKSFADLVIHSRLLK